MTAIRVEIEVKLGEELNQTGGIKTRPYLRGEHWEHVLPPWFSEKLMGAP